MYPVLFYAPIPGWHLFKLPISGNTSDKTGKEETLYVKKLSSDPFGKAEKILREMDGLEGVRSVSISEDLKELDVEAEENSFSLIMDRTVNICRRVADDCEITFMFR